MDGIDVALIETDGAHEVVRGPALTYPYSAEMRNSLRKGLHDGAAIQERHLRPGRLALLEQYLTDLHIEVVGQFLDDIRMKRSSIDVIGFHGQTVLHRPADGLSVQIGDGSRLARETGIDVVYDLRGADIAAGGMGAPLVPIYHKVLARFLALPVVIVNVGGVANVTFIGKVMQEGMMAFDTGPGNALIDDWMLAKGGQRWDKNGTSAAGGKVNEQVLTELLANPYFTKRPPKALDRSAFDMNLLSGLSLEDGAATLTSFTARTIGRARRYLPEEPQQWIICGGGRRNKTLMMMLASCVENAVLPAEAVGLGGDSIEAEAWAYLAVRSLKGLPITFPDTTGVPRPLTGGVLARA